MKINIQSRICISRVLSIILFLNIGAGASPLRAENLQLSLLSEAEFLDEVPTIISASRLPQLQSEAPAAVTIIDSEMIKASGVRHISDLLVLVPGFQLGHFNSSQSVVTYHGLANQFPRNMQILVDGRSIYSPMFRGAFWADLTIAIENIERIEVIRGPNTVSYGSNAFFGVINIITRHAAEQLGSYVKGVVGSNDIRDVTLRHAWRSGEHHFRLTGAWQEDAGFDSRIDDIQAGFIDFNAEMRLSAEDAFEVSAGINRNDYVEDFIDSSIPVAPDTREVSSQYEQLRWRHSTGLSEEISVQFFHQRRDQIHEVETGPFDFSFLGLGTVTVPIDFNATEDRYDLELQQIFKPTRDMQVVWGAGTRLDRMNSKSYFATNETFENRVHWLFGQTEWHVTERLVVNAGAIIEDSDVAGTDISPRLALNFHLAPRHTLRTSASKATRMPALVEDRGNHRFIYAGFLFDQVILGSGGLENEIITTYEVAYLGRLSANTLGWGLRVYRDLIQDRITEITIPIDIELSPEREAFSFVNEGEVEVTGAELELNYQPVTELRVNLNLSRMEVATSGFGPPARLAQRTETIERSVPDYSFAALLSYQFSKNWQASLLTSRFEDMEWLGDGDTVQGYTKIDFSLAREFQWNNLSSRLAATAQNLGDEYDDFRNENKADTYYYVSYGLQF